ncbi:hypothetical protein B0H15DRAFT_931998 [Mycena belliarum]|uniref:60S acidic ribosomal protein P1 n=1 Tax=Mycena belliarum TaxID=1033014 RepID=A0AAD6XP38_9AGAR|nr:hypothetical protein B0H15DRAFT_931998 [Mycena belliae]
MQQATPTELATTYAALILVDAESAITPDKLLALTSAAGVEIEPVWAALLVAALEGKNIKAIMLATLNAANDVAPGPADADSEPVDSKAPDGDSDSESYLYPECQWTTDFMKEECC